jgi:serine/threonine protein kinase
MMESWSCPRCATAVSANVVVCPQCGAVGENAGTMTLSMARPKLEEGAASSPRAPSPVAASEWPEEPPSGSMAAWRNGRTGSMAPGEVFANRFRIERLLGSGSLGTAFVARAAGVQGFICLKLMHPRKAVDKQIARDWVRLQDAVTRYQSPGIAKVYEAGVHQDIPWMAMEYVPGPTLRMWMLEKLQFDTRVPPGLDLIQRLIRIFDRIHELGCYGVIKPENVVVTPKGPVLMDFGVPGFLTPQEFEFNAYARRYLPYMAPELRQDFANLLPQSDYYSIGALLYEILTGRPPAAPVTLPSSMSPIFGIEADEIILKSLAESPQDRFGSNIGFEGALNAMRQALAAKRPAAFPQNAVFDDPPTGTSAIHTPSVVADPEQDFEPHQPIQAQVPLQPLPEESDTDGVGTSFKKGETLDPSAMIEMVARHTAMTDEASATRTLVQGSKDGSESGHIGAAGLAGLGDKEGVQSPWAALEARMSEESLPGDLQPVASRLPQSEVEQVKPFEEDWLASKPTPWWVWLLIFICGIGLTAVAGLLGYHFGH